MDNLISIIVPAFNIENHVIKCLDSLINQTYKNIEIIVVDDGSTDHTADILDEYVFGKSKVKVFHKNNEGVTHARLYGVSKSSGAYIGFVDGDDYVEEMMFENLMRNMKEYDADISHCGYQLNYPDGRTEYVYGTKKTIVQDNLTGMKDLLEGKFMEPGLWNKLFRRELLREIFNKPFVDQDIRINEDLLMNYYLFQQAHKSIYEDFCPYHYVLRKNSASKVKINEHRLKDPMRVLEILLEETNDNRELIVIVYQRIIRQLVNIVTMDKKENPKLIEPYRYTIRVELRKNILKILFKSCCGSRLKIMAFWACICPSSYRFVHKRYEKIKGLDKKFSAE